MRLQILMLTIGCLGSAPAWASAGLTSAGVDPTPANNQQSEPTLAQVAPQATQGTTGTVAGTITPGVVSAATAPGGVASVAGTAGTNGAAGGVAAAPRVVVPPPDPATLPVSVIRPVNKADSATPTGADGAASGDSATTSLQQTRAARAPLTGRSSVAAASASPPSSSPTGLRPAAAQAPRTDAAARAAPESATDEPANASASGFIFYVGVGIAATILLLSLAAFLRGGGAETGKPRSM